MKWLTIIDYGGIGDNLATSVVLSGFRRPDVRICYITRLWDNHTMLACIGPYCVTGRFKTSQSEVWFS